jgi:hypothetical protein
MWGAQLNLEHHTGSGLHLRLAAAFWDYRITSLEHADAGDVRGNRTTADGTAYLSDFDLADINLAVELPGPTDAWPVRIVADYVRNLGTAGDDDEGYGLDITLGRPWTERALLLRYGYTRCETDAVLGTFSHDNIPLATGYRNHTLSASYGLLEDTSLSLTWYYFSRLPERSPAQPTMSDEYSSRVRLDLMVRF